MNIHYESNITPIIPEIPEVDGFRFDGWYSDEGLTQLFTGTTMPAENIELYGMYVELTGTISFSLNGGSGTAPADIVDTMYSTITEFPSDNGGTAFYRDEYVFMGWGLTPDADEALTEYTIESEDTVTLYAIWAPAAIELISRQGSSSIVDNGRKYITGLKVGITAEELINQYLDVDGDGTIIAPTVIGTGAVIKLKNNRTGEIVDEFTVIIYGDLNGDGQITQTDMILLKTILAGTSSSEYEDVFLMAVDFNKDENLTLNDFTQMKSIISGSRTVSQQTGVVV